MRGAMQSLPMWLRDIGVFVTVGVVLGATTLGAVAVLFFNSDMEPWWAGAWFGFFAGTIATAIIFLARAIRFAASKIKQALRRRISTRHARKSQGTALPDGD